MNFQKYQTGTASPAAPGGGLPVTLDGDENSANRFFVADSASLTHKSVARLCTQVVWRSTIEIGCARSFCPNQGQIWVCHHNPFGNVIGETPY